MKLSWTPALVAGFLLAMVSLAPAQLFTSTLDDGTGWGIVANEDTDFTFGFDYSPFGIPPAPNGTGTTGLRMAANLVDPGAPAGISAYPEGLDLSGQYQVQVDFWLNFNSSGGTTEFGGGFVGFDPTAGSPYSGAGFLGDTDGDTGADYRLYKDGNLQDIASGQYAIPSNDNVDPVLQAQFPGQTTPAAQGDAAVFNPTNVIVTAPNGTLGYGWHTLTIDVDSGAGTAKVAIDDFDIGTINSNVGDPVSLTGPFALTFADLFNSVSTKPEFSFGVFDNVVVTQIPEPSSALLALCGLLVLAASHADARTTPVADDGG